MDSAAEWKLGLRPTDITGSYHYPPRAGGAFKKISSSVTTWSIIVSETVILNPFQRGDSIPVTKSEGPATI